MIGYDILKRNNLSNFIEGYLKKLSSKHDGSYQFNVMLGILMDKINRLKKNNKIGISPLFTEFVLLDNDYVKIVPRYFVQTETKKNGNNIYSESLQNHFVVEFDEKNDQFIIIDKINNKSSILNNIFDFNFLKKHNYTFDFS